MLENINMNQPLPVSINVIIVNVLVGAFLALIIKIHFKRFSSTLTNKNQFSNIFPIILLTTLLVISIVKSSLALSLGLVGALSIVRFRTPIKEPEELGYLFLTIAAGLGLGANQTMPTVSAIIGILIVISLFKFNTIKNNDKEKNIFLNLEYKIKSKKQKDTLIKDITNLMNKNSIDCDLRRMDIKDYSVDFAFLISLKNIDSLQLIIKNLEKNYPGIAINYIDQKQIPSV
mgnify:CR=1 FL=1|jgi:hypothetical protein|tara:strand:- start:2196 stop:2888 length:693 start_codon:yes stop_codon:yes gene_type:complete